MDRSLHAQCRFPRFMDEDNPSRITHQRRLQSIIRDLDSIARLLEQASADSVREEIKVVRERLDSPTKNLNE